MTGSNTATPDTTSKKLALASSSSSTYQSYNEMKDKRNPIAETILEVDDEEDSPEVEAEEILTDWLDESDTPVIDSSDPVNIKPITQIISKNNSNDIDAHSLRNTNTDKHRIDDVIVEEKINKTPWVTQHAQGSKTFTASDSSVHTALSSANKYDSTQRTLSHQTVINETKKSPVVPVAPVATVSSSSVLEPPPLPTQKSSDSDIKKENTEISKRNVDIKNVNTATTSSLNKVTKDNDSIDMKNEEIKKENVRSYANHKNVTEIKKKIDEAKKMEKGNEDENEIENENEEIMKENLEIKTIISPIFKSSSSMRSTESEEFGKNFSPLFPEPNYVSPSLTAPLGAEGEETLEVRTYALVRTCILTVIVIIDTFLFLSLLQYFDHITTIKQTQS